MTIDPEQVTADSLEKYESLMKGSVARASSNASYRTGASSNSQHLNTIHTWRNDSGRHESTVGTFEMKFEKPTSLVSLNIDIAFDCSDSAKLLHCLKPDVQGVLTSTTSSVEASAEESKEASGSSQTQQI